MSYDLYPAVDNNFDFPPEIRARLAVSVELRNTVVPMSESDRNNLAPGSLWNGRLIFNTTSQRVNRYSTLTSSWTVLMEQADVDGVILNATPIGAIVAYGSNVAPTGWHLCDGTAHSSAALTTVLTIGGHANPHLTPDLRDRFILGDGGSQPVSGGAATVTLTAAESGIRAHAHPTGTSTTVSADHSHWIDPPNTATSGHTADHEHYTWMGGGGHGHNSSYGNNYQLSSQDQNLAGTVAGPIANTDDRNAAPFTDGSHSHDGWSGGVNRDHAHYVDIGGFSSGGISANHTHNFTPGSNTDGPATSAHNNMPPFYTLTYIIKTI